MIAERQPESPWDLIDAVPVVNLDNRPERWEKFLSSANGMLPEDKMFRFSASLGSAIPGYGTAPWFKGKPTDSRWAGKAGCTLSHQRIMAKAKEQGWEMLLILEDDADFSETDKDELAAVLWEVLSKRSSWDICFLGFSKTRGPSRPSGKAAKRDIFEITGCGTTHAYLVNAKARNWLVDQLPSEKSIWPWIAKHRVIDRWYSWNLSLKLKVLAVSPSIITQATGFSDLVGKNVDYSSVFPGKVTRFASNGISFHLERSWWRARGISTLLHDSIRYLIKCEKGF
jgi:glycosyl transferase family 25